MAVREVEKELATKAGRLAARTGKPLTACPYDIDGPRAVLALAFVRGWRGGQDAPTALTKAADPDVPHTGAMVALIPTAEDADRLAVDGGEPVEELHVTLMYLGKAADIPPATQAQIIGGLRSMVEDAWLPDYDGPVAGDGFSVSVFNPGDSSDFETCIVLGISGPDVGPIHRMVSETVREAGGFTLPKQHDPWVPHLTLTYTDDLDQLAELTDRAGPITFDRIRVAFAGDTIDIPLDATWKSAVTKAAEPGDGGADPKGPTPPDQRWPGWEQDLALAAAAAAAITAAMAAGLTTTAANALADSFLHWARSWQPGQPAPDVVGWLHATTDLPERIEQAITRPIVDAWTQGYMVGERSAEAVLALLEAGESPRAAVSIQVDWGGWQPGDVAAARRILTEDGSWEPFEALLRDSGAVIKGITGNRLGEIAKALAEGLIQGHSPEKIAKAVNDVVNDPRRAYNIAITETTRALSAATLDSYVEAGIVATSWMTALDQRVCKICWENEFEAPGVVRVVAIGFRYPSGDLYPPAHPGGCRCTLIPVLDLDFLTDERRD